MNAWAHWVSLLSAVIHLGSGLSVLLQSGPRFSPASWKIIQGWLPDDFWWVWPGCYVLTGVVALVGVRVTRMLRLGLLLSAALNLIWGSVSVYGWIIDEGGTIPGSLTFWFLAGVLLALWRSVAVGKRSDKIDEQVAVLAERVDAVAHGQ